MALRKVWLVMPLPGASNPNNEDNELRQERPSRIGRNNGGVRLDRNQVPERYYTSEAEAITECESKASTNPMIPYVVMSIHTIRETAKPTVIAKRFTDDGELVIV